MFSYLQIHLDLGIKYEPGRKKNLSAGFPTSIDINQAVARWQES